MTYAALVERADAAARHASDLLADMAHRVSRLTPGDDATEYALATDAIERTFARVLQLRNDALADYRAADYAYNREYEQRTS
jgi:hypothetical protein